MEDKDYKEQAPESLNSSNSSNSSNGSNSSDSNPKSPDELWAEKLHIDYEPPKIPTPPPYESNPPIPEGAPGEAPAPQAPGDAPEPFPPYGGADSGSNYPPYQGPDSGEKPAMPATYLLWSVLATVCCCVPAGVAAIVFSSMVSGRYFAGDYEGAERASRRAEIWIIVSIVLGVIGNAFYLPLMLLTA